MLRGMLGAGGSLLFAVWVASTFLNDLEPSPELLRTMAGIGASFFLAYVIEASWLAKTFTSDDEVFLGFLMGFACAGLLGVIFALLLSERPAAEHFGRDQDLQFWWSAISLGGLGLLVAIQPGIVQLENEKTVKKRQE